jgi:hypothetical protein
LRNQNYLLKIIDYARNSVGERFGLNCFLTVSKRCKQGQKKGNKLKPVNRKNLCALLIIDLDGTVLRTDKTISLRFKEAAREASNKGIKLVFASGRTLENLIDFVTELEFSQ